MGLILPFIYIILFTESLMLIFKTKFETTLPLTFIISAIMLFISEFIFKTFYIGFILCLIFSLAFVVFLIKNRKKINFKKDYLTSGLIAFIIIYLVIFILDFNRFFTRWDELSHWGKMVKEMYKLNSFYSENTANLLVHKDYPPIMSLLELFFCYLSFGFKEKFLIRCMHLFESSLIISIIPLKEVKKKDILFKVLIPIIFIYLITLLFDTALVINSIYTDYVLALLTSYIIYNVFKTDKLDTYNIVNISLSLVFLILLKQVSIAFYLMTIFLMIINLVLKKYKVEFKKLILSILLIIILPLIFLGIWNSYIKSLNIKGQFEISDIKVSEFKNIISNNSNDNWQKEALNNYANALFEHSIINSKLKVSYAILGIILLFIMYLIYIKYKDKIKLKEYIPLCSTLLIGYFGYTILMMLLYIFSFGEIEGVELSSYDRYMSTYILICLYTFIFMLIELTKLNVKDKNKYIISIFIVLVMIEPISYAKLRPDLIILKNHYFDIFESSAILIDKHVDDMDKVYVIDEVEKEGSIFYINYFSNKISTNCLNYELITNIDNPYDYFYQNYYEYMSTFDYVYMYSINDEVIDKYSFLTDKTIKDKTLYKIEKDNKNLYLKEIDSLK